MKLVIYAHSFAPQIGGAETYVMLLAQGMIKQNVDVTVITRSPAGTMDDGALPFRVVRRPKLFQLFRLLRQADVVQLAGPCSAAMLVGLLLRKPVVIEHHGYQAICPNGLLLYEPDKTLCPGHFMAHRFTKCLRCNATNSNLFRSWMQLLATFPRRWAAHFSTANTPITQHVEGRLHLPRSRVIYYGIPDPYNGAEPLPPIFRPGQALLPTFAFVGRLVSEKGIPILLQAAAKLNATGRSFQVEIIGDGPERAGLETSVRTLGLGDRVKFLGSLSGAPLLKQLMLASAVVMPSVWEETAGLVAIEHMMRGGIVVSSDIGGLGEVVGDAGLKFSPGDVAGLAACLVRLLDDRTVIEQLGSRARERAKRFFLLDRMLDEHLSLYRQICGGVRQASWQPL